jgi:cell division protein ZapA
MDGAPEKKPVRVTIFNQHYTILSSGDPQEVEELARRVDDLMFSITARGGNIDVSRTAVLACLHLADQLRAVERELADLKGRVEAKSREFTLLLDQAVSE